MTPIRITCATTLLMLAGCAAAPVQDSTALEVTDEEIGRYWSPKTETIRRRLDTSVLRKRSGELRPMAQRVTVTYLIDSSGEVRDARVLKATPTGANAEWALTAVSAFSYEPTAVNSERTPVRRTHSLTMGTSPTVAQ